MRLNSLFFATAILCFTALFVFAETPAGPAGPDPNQTLEYLLDGNKRFSGNLKQHPHQQPERRVKLAKEGQKPVAIILTCSDSRVPPEIIFDMGLGDIFVVRDAGNIADKTEIGSIEYGAGHLGATLLVVLGHTKCGAVTAAVKKSEVSGNITGIIKTIEPAVEKARAENKGAAEEVLIQKAIKANVWQTIEDIFKNSPEVRKLVREAKLKVVGGLYDIETGVVTNLGVHARQQQLLNKFDGIPDE
jgi:carbonic anhydrase